MCILSFPISNKIQEISDPSSQVTVFIIIISLSLTLKYIAKANELYISCINLGNYLYIYTNFFASHKANDNIDCLRDCLLKNCYVISNLF